MRKNPILDGGNVEERVVSQTKTKKPNPEKGDITPSSNKVTLLNGFAIVKKGYASTSTSGGLTTLEINDVPSSASLKDSTQFLVTSDKGARVIDVVEPRIDMVRNPGELGRDYGTKWMIGKRVTVHFVDDYRSVTGDVGGEPPKRQNSVKGILVSFNQDQSPIVIKKNNGDVVSYFKRVEYIAVEENQTTDFVTEKKWLCNLLFGEKAPFSLYITYRMSNVKWYISYNVMLGEKKKRSSQSQDDVRHAEIASNLIIKFDGDTENRTMVQSCKLQIIHGGEEGHSQGAGEGGESDDDSEDELASEPEYYQERSAPGLVTRHARYATLTMAPRTPPPGVQEPIGRKTEEQKKGMTETQESSSQYQLFDVSNNVNFGGKHVDQQIIPFLQMKDEEVIARTEFDHTISNFVRLILSWKNKKNLPGGIVNIYDSIPQKGGGGSDSVNFLGKFNMKKVIKEGNVEFEVGKSYNVSVERTMIQELDDPDVKGKENNRHHRAQYRVTFKNTNETQETLRLALVEHGRTNKTEFAVTSVSKDGKRIETPAKNQPPFKNKLDAKGNVIPKTKEVWFELESLKTLVVEYEIREPI